MSLFLFYLHQNIYTIECLTNIFLLVKAATSEIILTKKLLKNYLFITPFLFNCHFLTFYTNQDTQ